MSIELKKYIYDWGGYNQTLFERFYGVGVEEYPQVLYALELLGNDMHFPYVVVAALVMLMLKYLFVSSKTKQSRDFFLHKSAIWLCSLMGGFALLWLVMAGLKEFIHFPRPYFLLKLPLLYGELPAKEALKSFPSSHVVFVAFWALIFYYQFGFVVRLLLGLMVVLICWSRVAIGMNFPVDVLCGIVIGGWSALTAVSISNRVSKLDDHFKQVPSH